MAGSSTAGGLAIQLEQVALLPFSAASGEEPPSHSNKLLEALKEDQEQHPSTTFDAEDLCILSQDFFCTPDYITPNAEQILNNFQDTMCCPRSPEKSIGNKRHRTEVSPCKPLQDKLLANQEVMDAVIIGSYENGEGHTSKPGTKNEVRYVSQSAVALRCRVMPPPCIKNPYLNIDSSDGDGIFSNRRFKPAGSGSSIYGDSLSRYRTDFHEIEQIGYGNFSRVFKVLKRIDGCMYAVKQNTKQLHNDTERMDALMEVQALAALGCHANIVGYYTSWFENDKLYIQMELCDRSMAINKDCAPKDGEILEALLQIATALDFMHGRGIAHMDVKPENIYVKNGIFKLGDFGCATMIDRSLRIDEGDARYMPSEMLNDKYEHLDKVDIFALGATAFELVKGSSLPTSGPLFCNLREGKIPLLPGCSMHLQNLIKAMMDPDPLRRPSAKQVMENAIFGQMKARKSVPLVSAK